MLRATRWLQDIHGLSAVVSCAKSRSAGHRVFHESRRLATGSDAQGIVSNVFVVRLERQQGHCSPDLRHYRVLAGEHGKVRFFFCIVPRFSRRMIN